MSENSRLNGGYLSQSHSQSLYLSQASQDYASQDQDYSITPRENHFNYAGSPLRKAKRGRYFSAFSNNHSQNGNDNKENDENEAPLFYMSQDSMLGSSQFSQDFSDRLCKLNVQSSQDTNPVVANDSSFVNEGNN